MQNTQRPPIVTVLGHVDHGKTTLLDAIRKTRVVEREAGGITQHIGAYQVTTQHGPITFIDTPGHEAFSAMRSRGAKVADIALLVVAANEGVKPQTRESFDQIKSAKIPYIIVASKIDLPSANVEAVKAQLEKEGVRFEGGGGDVPFVKVSGKTGEGITHLLEIISLVSQLHEISDNKQSLLEATVIESASDPRRGPVATVVVRQGKIGVGDEIWVDDVKAKVRSIIDEQGNTPKELLPGYAAQIQGFISLPPVGSKVFRDMVATPGAISISQPPKIDKGQFKLIVKADTLGTLEALVNLIPQQIGLISKGTGELNQNDVMFASSFAATIIAFGVKIPQDVAKLAQEEGVVIKQFFVIYEAIKWIKEVVEAGAKPEIEEGILGKGEIVGEFPFGKDAKIAGVRIVEGRIAKGDKLRFVRKGEVMGQTKIASLKQKKLLVDRVSKGEESGIVFQDKFDFRIGDVIESIR